MNDIPRESRGGRLREKIFLAMLLVSVVPTAIAGFQSLASIIFTHRLDVANLEDALTAQKAIEVRNFLAENFDLKLQTDVSQGGLDLAAQEFLLRSYLDDLPALESISFVSLDGLETARFSRLRPEGVGREDLLNVGRTERFREVSAKGGFAGDVNFSLRGPLVPVGSVVSNKDGIPIAYVFGEVNLSALQNSFRESLLGKTGYLYLVDRDGFAIAHGSRGSEGSLKGTGIVSDLLAGRDFLGAEGQQRYMSADGEPVVAAGRYLPEYGWGIVAEWPVSEADEIIRSLLLRNFLIIILVLGAAVLASALLATRIVRPVKVLEDGAARVARGEFDEAVSIRTGDEIEDLGAAFNGMMAGLKQLRQLKDEFVFIAAHELRTPVAAIKGYLSLIDEGLAGPVNKKLAEFLKKVSSSNARLVRLVDDLLEVARSDAGRLVVQVAPIDPSAPIRATLTELQPLADEKAMAVSYQEPPAPVMVMADSDRVREVMVNLVGNAIKYTPNGGKVRISHELGKGTLLTRVEDTGIGLSPEEKEKLFQKFYRAQNEDTKGIKGTGLGLFIVKQIVEKMNGRIWVESEKGKGSVFCFELPLAGA